jgi:hypothetical protein
MTGIGNEVPDFQAANERGRSNMDARISKEIYNIMDALVALKIDLKCDPHIPGEMLVLSAQRARDACEALEAASSSLKGLVAALDGGEGGSTPRH